MNDNGLAHAILLPENINFIEKYHWLQSQRQAAVFSYILLAEFPSKALKLINHVLSDKIINLTSHLTLYSILAVVSKTFSRSKVNGKEPWIWNFI